MTVLPNDPIDLRPVRIVFNGERLVCFTDEQEESLLSKLRFKEYYKKNTIDLLDVYNAQNQHIDSLQSVIEWQGKNLDTLYNGFKEYEEYGEDALDYSRKLNRKLIRTRRTYQIGIPLAIMSGYLLNDAFND